MNVQNFKKRFDERLAEAIAGGVLILNAVAAAVSTAIQTALSPFQSTLTIDRGDVGGTCALRFGKTVAEGLEVMVVDEVVAITAAVETNLTNTIPAGSVILSVQANLQDTIAGDTTGDNGLVKIGIGVTADPDKYGLTPDLVKNSKANKIPAWAVLAGAEQICIKAAGAAVTEKFTAVGSVRVRVVYLHQTSLINAA